MAAARDQKGIEMTNQATIPLLFPEEFNDNAAYLLQLAEAVVFEECCNNGCAHKADGTFMGHEVGQPTNCRHFRVSAGAPIECAAFFPECGDAA